MAVAILFMGIASPLFTRRMAASVDNILDQTSRLAKRRSALASHLLRERRTPVVHPSARIAAGAAPAERQVRQ